jgi:hypothetical protein
MENHSLKINYAFTAWIVGSADLREAFTIAVDLMVNLKRGREPSMYSDLRTDPDRAQIPRDIVREEAARDCVRLAQDCVAHAIRHVTEKEPPHVTRADDKLFTMKTAQFREILNTEDFWWYLIARMESGNKDWVSAVLGYEQDHAKLRTLFKNP